MRSTVIGLGLVAATVLATPAMAEDVYVRGPGFRVGVGDGHHHSRTVERRVYSDDDFARSRCRTIIIKKPGMVKKIRKCR